MIGGVLGNLGGRGSQLSGDFRRFFHCPGEHGSNASILQHEKPPNGAARGSGDIVAKGGRMPARVKHHASGAQSGLRDESQS